MTPNIQDEFSQLEEAVVCWGYSIPNFKEYSSNDPEFTKYHKRSWDRDLLLRQQDGFFNKLSKYGVKLRFPETADKLVWQMYTRDTAFVISDTIYFAKDRGLKEREGEIEALLKLLSDLSVPPKNIIELTTGRMEGGDVLIDTDQIYIGNGSRTTKSSIDEILKKVKGTNLFLGENVMHLDTRFTILPDNFALIHKETFNKEDLKKLNKRFKLIEVLEEELVELGTNVLVINPETIFSPKHNTRINSVLKEKGFNVEELDYTEPINLGGSFRCTTMPLMRKT